MQREKNNTCTEDSHTLFCFCKTNLQKDLLSDKSKIILRSDGSNNIEVGNYLNLSMGAL
jgi:hypothetical protein